MVHKFLNYLNTLADNIEDALDILTKKYPNISYKVYDNLVIFKYNASYGSEIERSCRGLIIDKNTGKIVCHSNEGTIDLESFIEKVDLGKMVYKKNINVFKHDTLVDINYRLQNLELKLMIDSIQILKKKIKLNNIKNLKNLHSTLDQKNEFKMIKNFERYKKNYEQIKS